MSQKLEFSGIHLKYRVYLPTLVGSCLRISNISWPPCLANLYCYHYFSFWQVFLKDTDERACAYIAGPAPNRWGFTIEGKDLFESINNISVDDGEFLS